MADNDWSRIYINDNKIINYLLSLKHPIGQSKAKFFRIIGYDKKNINLFKDNLLKTVDKKNFHNIESSEYGKKYIFESNFENPKNIAVKLRTIWVKEENDTTLKFVTAYPI